MVATSSSPSFCGHTSYLPHPKGGEKLVEQCETDTETLIQKQNEETRMLIKIIRGCGLGKLEGFPLLFTNVKFQDFLQGLQKYLNMNRS